MAQTPAADGAAHPLVGWRRDPELPFPSRAFRSYLSRGQRGLPCLPPPQPDR